MPQKFLHSLRRLLERGKEVKSQCEGLKMVIGAFLKQKSQKPLEIFKQQVGQSQFLRLINGHKKSDLSIQLQFSKVFCYCMAFVDRTQLDFKYSNAPSQQQKRSKLKDTPNQSVPLPLSSQPVDIFQFYASLYKTKKPLSMMLSVQKHKKLTTLHALAA